MSNESNNPAAPARSGQATGYAIVTKVKSYFTLTPDGESGYTPRFALTVGGRVVSLHFTKQEADAAALSHNDRSSVTPHAARKETK